MTPRDDLRRALEEYLARRYGGRWSVGLAGDETAQATGSAGMSSLPTTTVRAATGSRHLRLLRTTTAP